MTINRMINGSVVEIELTSEEQKLIYAEGTRQAKIRESILMLCVKCNIDLTEEKLTKEQEDLLVRMAESYQDSFYDYGHGFSWSSTYESFYKNLCTLFPRFVNH